MGGDLYANRNPSSLLFSKYKFVTLLTLIFVVIEIYSVQQWESESLMATLAHNTEWNLQHVNVQQFKKSHTKVNKGTVAVLNGEKKEVVQIDKPVKKQPQPDYTYAVRKYVELEDDLKKHLEKATDKKIILVWVPMFGVERPITIDQKQCGNCEVTYDRSMISDERTGAVIFHFDKLRKNDMPKPRNPKQLHIYWALESSGTLRVRRKDLPFENSYRFNDTMTYRIKISPGEGAH